MQRRSLLTRSAAMAGLAAFSGCGKGASAVTVAAVATSRVIDLNAWPASVVIELEGTEHRFDERAGTSLGDYVDPAGRFIESCVGVKSPSFPAPEFRVMFRRIGTCSRAGSGVSLGELAAAQDRLLQVADRCLL